MTGEPHACCLSASHRPEPNKDPATAAAAARCGRRRPPPIPRRVRPALLNPASRRPWTPVLIALPLASSLPISFAGTSACKERGNLEEAFFKKELDQDFLNQGSSAAMQGTLRISMRQGRIGFLAGAWRVL